jgi:hypothetical protein
MLPSYLGYYYAGQLIKGDTGSLSIAFEPNVMKDPLILVMYHNDNYYVVEECNPAPDNAKLCIIPANKFNKTIINTI